MPRIVMPEIPGPHSLYGVEIFTWIEDKNGAIICPDCNLEMACSETHHLVYCGSGNGPDGHFLSMETKYRGPN